MSLSLSLSLLFSSSLSFSSVIEWSNMYQLWLISSKTHIQYSEIHVSTTKPLLKIWLMNLHVWSSGCWGISCRERWFNLSTCFYLFLSPWLVICLIASTSASSPGEWVHSVDEIKSSVFFFWKFACLGEIWSDWEPEQKADTWNSQFCTLHTGGGPDSNSNSGPPLLQLSVCAGQSSLAVRFSWGTK